MLGKDIKRLLLEYRNALSEAEDETIEDFLQTPEDILNLFFFENKNGNFFDERIKTVMVEVLSCSIPDSMIKMIIPKIKEGNYETACFIKNISEELFNIVGFKAMDYIQLILDYKGKLTSLDGIEEYISNMTERELTDTINLDFFKIKNEEIVNYIIDCKWNISSRCGEDEAVYFDNLINSAVEKYLSEQNVKDDKFLKFITDLVNSDIFDYTFPDKEEKPQRYERFDKLFKLSVEQINADIINTVIEFDNLIDYEAHDISINAILDYIIKMYEKDTNYSNRINEILSIYSQNGETIECVSDLDIIIKLSELSDGLFKEAKEFMEDYSNGDNEVFDDINMFFDERILKEKSDFIHSSNRRKRTISHMLGLNKSFLERLDETKEQEDEYKKVLDIIDDDKDISTYSLTKRY